MFRRAIIAGGGIAGLAAGAALAQRGWVVRIYERSPELRTFGAGIYIWENGLRVLESLGAYDEAIHDQVPAWRREARDARNRVFRRNYVQGSRLFTIVRRQLLLALLNAAQRSGCDIEFGAEIQGASDDGRLKVGDHWTEPADLVVGADGVNSKVRDSFDLIASRKWINQFAIRVLIERQPEELQTELGRSHCEHWSGKHRLLYAPCTPALAYVQLTSPTGDERGNRIPIEPAYWHERFPYAGWIIDRVPEDGRGDPFQILKLRRWSQGRVAIIGDAAHAQPPNLGQGGGSALMNALSLAVALESADPVPTALARWEAAERPLIEFSQNVAYRFGQLCSLPDMVRAPILKGIDRSNWLKTRTIMALALHRPTGSTSMPGSFPPVDADDRGPGRAQGAP